MSKLNNLVKKLIIFKKNTHAGRFDGMHCYCYCLTTSRRRRSWAVSIQSISSDKKNFKSEISKIAQIFTHKIANCSPNEIKSEIKWSWRDYYVRATSRASKITHKLRDLMPSRRRLCAIKSKVKKNVKLIWCSLWWARKYQNFKELNLNLKIAKF